MEGGRVGKGEQVLGFNIICFPLLAGLHTNQSIPGWLPQTGFAVVQLNSTARGVLPEYLKCC